MMPSADWLADSSLGGLKVNRGSVALLQGALPAPSYTNLHISPPPHGITLFSSLVLVSILWPVLNKSFFPPIACCLALGLNHRLVFFCSLLTSPLSCFIVHYGQNIQGRLTHKSCNIVKSRGCSLRKSILHFKLGKSKVILFFSGFSVHNQYKHKQIPWWF